MNTISPLPFESLNNLFEQRRSIRYFNDEKISMEDLQKLINVAEVSPSVENTKPWHFYVIQNAEMKHAMMEHSCYGNFVEGASAFIVVTCDKATQKQASEPLWNTKEMEYSCAIAMEHIMLAALTMNIGSCFISLHHGPVHTMLKLPDHVSVVGGIMLGYIRKGEIESYGKHDRRSTETIATFID